MKARAAAAAKAAGFLRAREGQFGIVWADKAMGEAWRSLLATDCYVEEVLDGAEVWRVELRSQLYEDDWGEVFDRDGMRVGMIKRHEDGTFSVAKYDQGETAGGAGGDTATKD